MLQPAAVKSPEPISHVFLHLFPPFPTSSCSYTMYIYLHRIHSSILVPTKIHCLQIFDELGNFLKMKRWMGVLGKDYIKERDIFCYPLGPCLLLPIPCYFVFPLPFLRARAESCSMVSLRAVPFMPLPRCSMSPKQLHPDVGSRLEERRGNIKHEEKEAILQITGRRACPFCRFLPTMKTT